MAAREGQRLAQLLGEPVDRARARPCRGLADLFELGAQRCPALGRLRPRRLRLCDRPVPRGDRCREAGGLVRGLAEIGLGLGQFRAEARALGEELLGLVRPLGEKSPARIGREPGGDVAARGRRRRVTGIQMGQRRLCLQSLRLGGVGRLGGKGGFGGGLADPGVELGRPRPDRPQRLEPGFRRLVRLGGLVMSHPRGFGPRFGLAARRQGQCQGGFGGGEIPLCPSRISRRLAKGLDRVELGQAKAVGPMDV